MRRLIIGLACVVVAVFGYFFWHQHQQQLLQQEQQQQQVFDQVMSEKMELLYQQAKDWKTPLHMQIKDARIQGDYKVMSEFILKFWMDNIEARNHYLRTLEQAEWDHFLDARRFEKDRAQGYRQTTQMLQTVKQASADFQTQREQITQVALAQVKTLEMKSALRNAMRDKLEITQADSDEVAILQLELQIIQRAEQMFQLLKIHPWVRQDKLFLFKDQTQVKQFNQLYQQVLSLQKQINEIKQQNARVFEQDQ